MKTWRQKEKKLKRNKREKLFLEAPALLEFAFKNLLHAVFWRILTYAHLRNQMDTVTVQNASNHNVAP